MIIKKISYKDGDINDFVADEILMEAKRAVQENSYGVGGALLDIKNGKVIKTMHNQVIANETSDEKSRLQDPTAHGERQLVDWYFENRYQLKLPEPEQILVVTTLDPCLMCTGSILSAGFKVIVVALDDHAGINWDASYTFKPLEGVVQEEAKENFIYPAVEGDSSRTGYGNVLIFGNKTLNQTMTNQCLAAFNEGANKARVIVKDEIPAVELKDISIEMPADIVKVLTEAYPKALSYKTASGTSIPDEGLAQILIEEANLDRQYGGDGDAVAFIDIFGNLLMCQGGKKAVSPIQSAFMRTARAYQRVRYELTDKSNDALYYLCDPSQGTFVFVRGFDKSAQSFADLGAYGSTMLNTPGEHNLQYIMPRISHEELLSYIAGMPERYSKIIKPELVENEVLRKLVEKGLED